MKQAVVVLGSFVRASHKWITLLSIGRKLARIKECAFHDEPPADPWADREKYYYVPAETLSRDQHPDEAAAWTVDDLFGGVVPYAFVATKAIVHGLRTTGSPAPEHWCHRFSESVRELVPNGLIAFSLLDALRAGTQMLERGALRIKPAWASGGRGQLVVSSPIELNAALSLFEEDEVATHGLVLEENLVDPITYSIGTVSLGEVNASYYGTQRVTNDNFGAVVYGGSDLIVYRGDFEALLRRPIPE